MPHAIELIKIRKNYPGVLANDDVSLFVDEGDIHGLIGENGAGKSTLMNILYGFTTPDEGTIRLFGRDTTISSPHDAIVQGIGMVHQHYMLMPNLTVLQNIILGKVPQKFGVIDNQTARSKIRKIISNFDLQVDLNAKIYQLTVGQKQRVEIIKALYREAKILILDEPTAVLTPSETDALMDMLRQLKAEGRTIIFITHKLREVLALTDNLTVMRKGRVTGRLRTSQTDTHELSRLMVGRDIDLHIPMDAFTPGKEVLSVEHLTVYNKRNLKAIDDLSLKVRTHEIVGIAGVEGNGQTDLIETITGMTRAESGEIFFLGEAINTCSIRKRRERGMSHIPEDRVKMGIAMTCSIKDNLILNRYYKSPYCRAGIMSNKNLESLAERLCAGFQIKTPNTAYSLGTLSGGNMQKAVVAREVEIDPLLLIAAQPTRGIDIGAIEYIHHKIVELRDLGKAVLLVSAELDEIMSLSDRILVIYEGRLVAEFRRGEADQQTIGMYMMGAKSRN